MDDEYIAHERSQSREDDVAAGGYWLVLVGRSQERGSHVHQSIQRKHPNLKVAFEACDLSDWKAVQQLQERIAATVVKSNNSKSHKDYQVGILVNNAAECPPRQKFVERNQKDHGRVKVDKQFASNVLGYHFMMRAFEDHFVMATTASDNNDDTGSADRVSATTTTTHIVNVASDWAGDLDLTDVHFQRRRYDIDSAYRQAKQCDRMLSHHWSQRLQGKALVNACHPGDPCTTLSTALGYNLYAGAPMRNQIAHDSPFPYLCGLSGQKLTTTGGWYSGTSTKAYRCGFERLAQDRERLFELCESFCTS